MTLISTGDYLEKGALTNKTQGLPELFNKQTTKMQFFVVVKSNNYTDNNLTFIYKR